MVEGKEGGMVGGRGGREKRKEVCTCNPHCFGWCCTLQLAHPILGALRDTDKQWLIDLLYAFNSGMCPHVCVSLCACVYMCAVFSRLFLGGAAPPYCVNIPPYQCFRGCCTPLRMMACTPDLCSVIITKQLHTCKYTAIHYAIVMLAENRGWIRD